MLARADGMIMSRCNVVPLRSATLGSLPPDSLHHILSGAQLWSKDLHILVQTVVQHKIVSHANTLSKLCETSLVGLGVCCGAG